MGSNSDGMVENSKTDAFAIRTVLIDGYCISVNYSEYVTALGGSPFSNKNRTNHLSLRILLGRNSNVAVPEQMLNL